MDSDDFKKEMTTEFFVKRFNKIARWGGFYAKVNPINQHFIDIVSLRERKVVGEIFKSLMRKNLWRCEINYSFFENMVIYINRVGPVISLDAPIDDNMQTQDEHSRLTRCFWFDYGTVSGKATIETEYGEQIEGYRVIDFHFPDDWQRWGRMWIWDGERTKAVYAHDIKKVSFDVRPHRKL
ncbi:hypothetical protein lacNasYZ01_10490 [Lactobacillus nasalidis]|nr:hypothetical protein lacNasYZ01_10490 [Lactobacillus nasalidis]